MRKLQYVFCILSALCAASAIIVGMLTNFLYALIVVAAAVLFAVLMLIVKRKLEPPAPKKRDFMDPEPEQPSDENKQDNL